MAKIKPAWIGYLEDAPIDWAGYETLAKLGYQAMEGGDNLLTGNAADNVKRFKDLGLRVLTAAADLDEIRAGIYRPGIEKARRLGADFATVYACSVNASLWGDNTPPEHSKAMSDIEAMEKAAKAFKEEGVRLCYHNHFQDFTVSFGGVRFFDHLLWNTEHLMLELDVGWVQNGGENPCLLMRRVSSRIAAIHVKDYIDGKPRQDNTGCMPVFVTVGNGVLDLPAILGMACSIGVKWAVAEQDAMYNLSPLESATASYLNMKETGYIE